MVKKYDYKDLYKIHIFKETSMRIYSFLYAILITLLVPMSYAMEKENTITSDVFTVEGKRYMRDRVASWADTARAIHRTQAGLGAAFDSIDYLGIEHLVSDQVALKRANEIYTEIVTDKTKNSADFFAFFDMRSGEQVGPIMKTSTKSSSKTAAQTAEVRAQLLVRTYFEQIKNAKQKQVQSDQDCDCTCVIF